MRAFFAALALAVFAACFSAPCPAAEAVKPPDMSPPDTWLPVQQGSLRIMNKIDSTVQTVKLNVGQTVTYQSLSVTLSGCFVRPQDLPADAAARLRIVDHRPDTPAFNGWILKREPSLMLYEHPVYDVQLAGCG